MVVDPSREFTHGRAGVRLIRASSRCTATQSSAKPPLHAVTRTRPQAARPDERIIITQVSKVHGGKGCSKENL
eukprot:364287-Chlamydomonas_euryale.AAC.3